MLACKRRSTLWPVQIINRANLSPQAFAALERELPPLGTLLQFVVWGSQQQPPVRLLETVAQDEYTHDVIAASHGGQDGLFFVFGAT
ncbi:MAG: hypothetical protein ABI977_04770 [Acidobacteriota bacterium]